MNVGIDKKLAKYGPVIMLAIATAAAAVIIYAALLLINGAAKVAEVL